MFDEDGSERAGGEHGRGDGGGSGREAAYCPMNIEDHALPRSANRKGDKLAYREHKPSGVGGL